MSKLVTLKITDGDFENGFRVFLQIEEDGETGRKEIPGKLPPAPMLPELYKDWQLNYRQKNLSFRGESGFRTLKKTDSGKKHFSKIGSANELKNGINDWLNSGDKQFRPVRDGLLRNLSRSNGDIRFIIQAQDWRIWQLPWHLWNVVEESSNVEVALSFYNYEQLDKPQQPLPEKVRILTILGNSEGIDTEKDRQLLEQIPSASITLLVEPDRQQLNDRLWDQPWDILFFAGHSDTEEETGKIDINRHESLSIDELRYALKKAIANGLKIVFFNSCDGLGLARQLADLKLPQMIVMREPVPDKVAQEFLKHFLREFEGGKSFHLAVREARERLQGLEGKFPSATWLPVICQNPAELPPTWKELYRPKERRFNLQRLWRTGRLSLRASIVITGLVMGLRMTGMLEGAELGAFDHLMRLRPDEGPDDRLLLVTATPEDIEKEIEEHQQKYGASLSDRTISRIFQKLEKYEPITIGWDIYRDFPVDREHPELKTYFQQENLFGICKVIDPKLGKISGIAPPPEISTKRIGFNDAVTDKDVIMRRYLLSMTPEEPVDKCTAKYNLSLLLAVDYLSKKHGQLKWELTSDEDLQLLVPSLNKTVVFQKLKPYHTGGYYKLDTGGRQILLNYRSRPALSEIATKVSVGDLLDDKIPANTVEYLKNRIVLIGVTAPIATNYDNWRTPYTASQPVNDNETPGVYIQAHMVSQILSAVLDDRPLLWVWHFKYEVFWIWSWSLVGGILAYKVRSPLDLGSATFIAISTLYGICYVFIQYGGWVPMIPSAIALVLAGGVAIVIRSRNNSSQVLTLETSIKDGI